MCRRWDAGLALFGGHFGMAFVGAFPHRFAPSVTTVSAGEAPAEWFDFLPPRHPVPPTGPGATTHSTPLRPTFRSVYVAPPAVSTRPNEVQSRALTLHRPKIVLSYRLQDIHLPAGIP